MNGRGTRCQRRAKLSMMKGKSDPRGYSSDLYPPWFLCETSLSLLSDLVRIQESSSVRDCLLTFLSYPSSLDPIGILGSHLDQVLEAPVVPLLR